MKLPVTYLLTFSKNKEVEGAINSEWSELIRCKDCKHWERKYEACFVHVQNSEDADSIILNMQADDFCSKGEREEEHEKGNHIF